MIRHKLSSFRQLTRTTMFFGLSTGDDPFALNVTQVATFTSSVYPYQGRYPCGSLFYKGTWWYGTYYLDNPNSTVSFVANTKMSTCEIIDRLANAFIVSSVSVRPRRLVTTTWVRTPGPTAGTGASKGR